MSFEYDAAIAVTPAGPGRFAAVLDDGWRVGGGLNGGYLLAVIGNAIRAYLTGSRGFETAAEAASSTTGSRGFETAAEAGSSTTGHPDPYAVSAYYLSAATAGPATVTVEPLRTGRGTTTVRASLVQGDTARISALATYGDLGRLDGDVRTTATPPVLPPPEQCRLTSEAPVELKEFVRMVDRVRMRLDPECSMWETGNPSGKNYLQGWFELADGRPIDPIALLTVVDTLPPTTLELGPPGWAPTLELTVHVRATPAPGPVRIRHETRNLAGGMFEEDCEVWDAADRLVAQSRQLALAPR